jgi:hypothetical protein
MRAGHVCRDRRCRRLVVRWLPLPKARYASASASARASASRPVTAPPNRAAKLAMLGSPAVASGGSRACPLVYSGSQLAVFSTRAWLPAVVVLARAGLNHRQMYGAASLLGVAQLAMDHLLVKESLALDARRPFDWSKPVANPVAFLELFRKSKVSPEPARLESPAHSRVTRTHATLTGCGSSCERTRCTHAAGA